jgi:hypothetical protein
MKCKMLHAHHAWLQGSSAVLLLPLWVWPVHLLDTISLDITSQHIPMEQMPLVAIALLVEQHEIG